MREAQAVSSSIALPSMASYATKDPIIVDNSNFSSTSSRNTPCATPCLRNAPTCSSHGVTTWSTSVTLVRKTLRTMRWQPEHQDLAVAGRWLLGEERTRTFGLA